MDTNNQNKNIQDNKVKNDISNTVYEKDQEILNLKKELAKAQEVNKKKVGDPRAELNSSGDIAKVCIGVNANGQRIFKEANKLTDADIKRRQDYIAQIKVENQKKD